MTFGCSGVLSEGGWCPFGHFCEERLVGAGGKDLGSHEKGSFQPQIQAADFGWRFWVVENSIEVE